MHKMEINARFQDLQQMFDFRVILIILHKKMTLIFWDFLELFAWKLVEGGHYQDILVLHFSYIILLILISF